MNRTRKIVAAGIATAVALVLIAMVLMTPNLHTQTPVSTVPPTNGGTGSGGSGNTGAGNGTTTSCTATGGNQTGENGDHDGSSSTACTSETTVDHDAMGDKMSSEHRNVAADEHIPALEADALAFAELGMRWTASAVDGLASLV